MKPLVKYSLIAALWWFGVFISGEFWIWIVVLLTSGVLVFDYYFILFLLNNGKAMKFGIIQKNKSNKVGNYMIIVGVIVLIITTVVDLYFKDQYSFTDINLLILLVTLNGVSNRFKIDNYNVLFLKDRLIYYSKGFYISLNYQKVTHVEVYDSGFKVFTKKGKVEHDYDSNDSPSDASHFIKAMFGDSVIEIS